MIFHCVFKNKTIVEVEWQQNGNGYLNLLPEAKPFEPEWQFVVEMIYFKEQNKRKESIVSGINFAEVV